MRAIHKSSVNNPLKLLLTRKKKSDIIKKKVWEPAEAGNLAPFQADRRNNIGAFYLEGGIF